MTTQFIINHLWQSSCFVLLAALLAFLLRKNSPKIRYWVWLSASLKFLIPFALLVSLGSVVPLPVRQPVSVPAHVFPNTLVQIAEPFSSITNANVRANASPRWMPVVIGVLWAIGFLGIALVRCRSWLRVRAALRASTPIELPIPVPALITPGAEEPGIVGYLNPVLVLPAQLLEHLNPRHVSAILAHELCHVRRRDNFFAAVHMVVEAIFWFNPLVWWVGTRMVEERELACDEDVLRMGFEPTDYVEGILKVCRFYSESPLPSVSGVTGSDVKKRVRTILAGSIAHELTGGKKMTLATIGLAALVVPILVGMLNASAVRAQDAPPTRPEFEVASVKPRGQSQAPYMLGAQFQVGGRISATNAPLFGLILSAFDLRFKQLQRNGHELLSESFDIDARADPNNLPQDVRLRNRQLQLMFQTVLTDRFRLAMHRETEDMPLYALVVAKNGPKLKLTPLEFSCPEGTNCGLAGGPKTGLKGRSVEISELIEVLNAFADRPVVDRTGIQGRFDLDLPQWNPSLEESPVPSLFAVLQEQLGLRLEAIRGPYDVFVVDHVEQPTPN
jgi:uncharacterized protein (TIGR03435 family)